jgi:hypothetical protein
MELHQETLTGSRAGGGEEEVEGGVPCPRLEPRLPTPWKLQIWGPHKELWGARWQLRVVDLPAGKDGATGPATSPQFFQISDLKPLCTAHGCFLALASVPGSSHFRCEAGRTNSIDCAQGEVGSGLWLFPFPAVHPSTIPALTGWTECELWPWVS